MPILSAFGAAKALGAGGGSVVVPDYSYDFGGSAYISAPSSTQFVAGTGDFTLEFFIYLRSTPAADAAVFDLGRGLVTNAFAFQLNPSRQFKFRIGAGSITSSTAISLNTWYFITLTRLSSALRFFYDTTNVTTNPSYTTNLSGQNGSRIGGNQNDAYRLDAIISNLRYRVGTGLSSVTIPTSPLQNVTNTKLLTCQSATIIDNSTANGGTGWTLTNSGATVTTTNPF